MEHSFWHSKWQKNEIGFHEPEGNALLVKHAHVLLSGGEQSSHPIRIFVPLCGKTRDIAWLLSQGVEVVGAEQICVCEKVDDVLCAKRFYVLCQLFSHTLPQRTIVHSQFG